MSYCLALDVGGANLKLADGQDYAASVAFPLWRRPEELSRAVAELLSAAPAAERLAVTMTGELADCYATKAEGVAHILNAVERAATGREVRVYLTSGEFVTPQVATERWLAAAASNWHALARFAGRLAPRGPALLIDIGSTTSDLVPLLNGRVAASALTDPERLLAGELVYTGVLRSPICTVTSTLPWRRRDCPVAQELFATTWDAYLISGALAEEADATSTADGQPATRDFAWRRMARVICADTSLFSFDDALAAAEAVERAQLAQLDRAARQVGERLPTPPETVLVSGRGEFLARKLIESLGWKAQVVSLAEAIGPQASASAPAHALAVLAREEL